MKLLLIASAGGAIGAGARYLLNVGFARWLGPGFPWSTFVANVSGCLLMGLITGLLAARLTDSPELRVFLTTGILGGYTTFSAYALDFAGLMERDQSMQALVYLVASVALSIVALYIGLKLARIITG